MSVVMDATEDDKRLLPASTLSVTGFPFTVFGWVKLPVEPKTSSAEWLQMFNVGSTNSFQLKTLNNATSTPATKTMLAVEQNLLGAGVQNNPEWDDAWTLGVWSQFVLEATDSGTDVLEVNNSVVAISDQRTNNIFNGTPSALTDWGILGRKASVTGSPPHNGNWAAFGVMDRALTVDEKNDLQLFWPSSIESLSSGGNSWDLDTGLAAAHGGVNLIDGKSGGSDSFTISADNPSITIKGGGQASPGLLVNSDGALELGAGGIGMQTFENAPQVAGLSTTFDIANTETSSSTGFIRLGMPFKIGDVPSGWIPKVVQGGSEITAIQFDRVVTWTDGSLKFCVIHMRDSSFSSLESRTYTITGKEGTFINNTGTFSLADIKTDSTWVVALSNVQEVESEVSILAASFDTTNGDATVTVTHISHGRSVDDRVRFRSVDDDQPSGPDSIGGLIMDSVTTFAVATVPDANSFTFEHTSTATSTVTGGGESGTGFFYTQINNHAVEFDNASETTLATKIHSGPVCDGWFVIQLVKDSTTSVDDGHFVATHYVDAWNDGSDTTNGNIEFATKLSMPQWDVASKAGRFYTATFTEGGSTKDTYSDIVHAYHAEWITVRDDNDVQAGRRHWQTDANRPTLIHKPNKDYWVTTRLIPPYETNLVATPLSTSKSTYIPMNNFKYNDNIDAGGASYGRGLMPQGDANAFMNTDHVTAATAASDMRVARVNAFAGLHVGYHFRTSGTRDRSSITADDYNNFGSETAVKGYTPIALTLAPQASFDFSGDGLSGTGVDAYRGGGATGQGGYTDYTGGDGVWLLSNGEDHGSNFTQFMYMIDGEPYFYDCLQDIAMSVLHKGRDVDYGRSNLMSYTFSERIAPWGIDATLWDGITCGKFANSRHNGWALNEVGAGWGLCANNDVARNYFDALIQQQGDYLTASLANYPAAHLARGLLWERAGHFGEAPFFLAIITQGMATFVGTTENADALAALENQVNFQLQRWNSGSYNMKSFRAFCHTDLSSWDNEASLHPLNVTYVTPDGGGNQSPLTQADDTITEDHPDGGVYLDTNVLYFFSKDGLSNNATIPPEASENVAYELFGSIAGTSFQVSEDSGVSAINFASDQNVAVGVSMTNAGQATNMTNGYEDVIGENTFTLARAGLIAARHVGSTTVTAATLAEIETFLNGGTLEDDPVIAFETL